MKHKILLLSFLLCCAISAFSQTKVACVGNSITYGATIQNRENNSYPAQLQAMLGSAYDVQNFGRSGATLLRKGDIPYVETNEYAAAIAYNPDVVFIKLGTNDSKLRNRDKLNDFVSDYNYLISSFKKSNPNVRVVLLSPMRVFTQPDTVNITASVIENQITPMVERVAFDNKIEIIHLDRLITEQQAYLIPDKVHPTSIGAGMLAARLYEYLHTDASMSKNEDLAVTHTGIDNFHGFECVNFEMNGVACKIAKPKQVRAGKPWVWRARFWGHEPQTDIALLERGFHIAYCDVADLFGAPVAVKRWNQFYALMQERGFSSRPALEGMSRGGLIVYNWAAQNPDKVACVYADAPVLDLKSWPLNRKNEELNKSLCKAYGFKSIAEVETFKGNPVDLCKTLAAAGFPMLHVCGEVDDVVPVSENTNVFEKRIKDNNGDIRIIRKADVNHHPHSLDNPTEIVRFITEATNTAFTITDKSVPGNEFRSAAGWTEGADWYANHKEISSVLASEQVDLLLVGNSITQGFGGDRSIVTYKPGKKYLDAVLQNKKWQAAGISGDKSQNILYRLENGNYNAASPKVVTLTIGINNLTSGNSPKETFIGIKKCIETAQRVLPNSKLVVFGVLPAGKEKNSDLRIKVDEVNKMLSDYTSVNKEFQYMNLDDVFTDSRGSLKSSFYAPDNLHLSGNGYAAWSKIIASLLD